MKALRIPDKQLPLWLVLAIGLVAEVFLGLAARADDEDAISSVITKLEVQKDAFEKTLSEELSPQRQKIHETFANAVGSLDDLILQLRRNPKNAELRQKYEETLTGALNQAEGLLGDYAMLREPTRRKFTSLVATLSTASKACGQQVTAHKQVLARQQEQAGVIKTKLQNLAEQYRAQLTSGQAKLPREVDQQIRLFEIDLAMANQDAQFSELAIRDFETVQSEIENQTEELDDLRSSLEVTFVQAEGQKQLLGKIADLRSRRGQAQRLGMNIAQMQPLVTQATQQNDKVNDLIQKFMEFDFRPRPDGVRKPSAIAQRASESSGAAILKKYLQTSTETEVSHAGK